MVVCVVVILLTFLAGCGVGVIVLVVYQKKSKQSTGMLCVYLLCVYLPAYMYKHVKQSDQKNVCINMRPSCHAILMVYTSEEKCC